MHVILDEQALYAYLNLGAQRWPAVVGVTKYHTYEDNRIKE
jgi:hypothetical protein